MWIRSFTLPGTLTNPGIYGDPDNATEDRDYVFLSESEATLLLSKADPPIRETAQPEPRSL